MSLTTQEIVVDELELATAAALDMCEEGDWGRAAMAFESCARLARLRALDRQTDESGVMTVDAANDHEF